MHIICFWKLGRISGVWQIIGGRIREVSLYWSRHACMDGAISIIDGHIVQYTHLMQLYCKLCVCSLLSLPA